MSLSSESVGAVPNPGIPIQSRPGVSISYFVAEDRENFKHQPNAELCEKCDGFINGWDQLRPIYVEYGLIPPEDLIESFQLRTSKGTIELSCQLGCPFCDILLRRLSAEDLQVLDSASVIQFFAFPESQNTSSGWIVAFQDKNFNWVYPAYIRPSVKWDTESPPAPLLRGKTTGSKYVLEKARSWYRTCKELHCECREETPRILPTRLLHYKHGQLTLSLSSNLPVETQYATLSHCWGQLEMFALTKERAEEFYTNVPIDRLCQTFQDALQVLTELGLEYLWIDSLCIIQDDKEDWNRESVSMSSVYGCSEVTIAAASAVDGTQGCFSERDLPIQCVLQVHLRRLQLPSTFDVTPPRAWILNFIPISSFPLSQRGWAYQERRLSPRIIYFTKYSLIWECLCRVGEEWETSSEILSYRQIRGQKLSARSSNFWNEVIREYSGCRLTAATDKLVAISGIAKRRQKAVPSEYVAGLWRDQLEHQLCWKRVPWSPNYRKPENYQAPSWSWASLSYPVEPAKLNYGMSTSSTQRDLDSSCSLDTKVSKVTMTLVTPDPMGSVSRGVLTLQCTCLLAGFGHSRERAIIRVSHFTLACFVILDYGKSWTESSIPYYFLPIRHMVESMEGLVMQPTHQVVGEYRRLGYFRSGYQTWRGSQKESIASCHWLLEQDNFSIRKQDRALLFASSEGELGPHVITLI